MTYWNGQTLYRDGGVEIARIESARPIAGIARWAVCWRGVTSKPTSLAAARATAEAIALAVAGGGQPERMAG